jgi:hypothetical protein
MALHPIVLRLLSDSDEDAIRTASRDEARDAVLEFFAQWENQRSVDFEVLMFAGSAVARQGHIGVDGDIEQWLNGHTSEKHWYIASSFLWGYWAFAEVIESPVLSSFMGMSDSLPVDSDAYETTLFALDAAANNARAMDADRRRPIVDLLLRHLHDLEAAGKHKGLVAKLRRLRGLPSR